MVEEIYLDMVMVRFRRQLRRSGAGNEENENKEYCLYGFQTVY
jgi:hypothetical protein